VRALGRVKRSGIIVSSLRDRVSTARWYAEELGFRTAGVPEDGADEA
jgi:hypothetical protein